MRSSLTMMSLRKSWDDTHRRTMSAPHFLMYASEVWGFSYAPCPCLLLEIFSRSASTMKPWVSTVRYGAAPLPASDSNSDDWNQPRCWSEHSRYISHWNGLSWPRISGRAAMTAREEEPESIHTSSVSLDLLTASALFQPFGFKSDQSSPTDFSNQTCEPCFATKSAAFRTICASRIGSP